MPALPSWLVKILRFALKRPSDAQIRVLRVVFALTLAYALFEAHGRYALLPAAWAAYDPAAQWALMALALPSLLTGLTGMCVAKKKTVRFAQLGLAVALFLLGGWLMRDLPSAEAQALPEDAAALSAKNRPAPGTRTGSFAEALAAGNSAPAELAAPQAPAATGGFDQAVRQPAAQPGRAELPAGFWIGLLAWLPLAAGVTGKTVLAKCQRYGEKVTKIRV